jgi:tRNA-uridine aminocarboxypropyltransferase
VGEDFSEHDEINALLSDKNRDVWIVYPGDGSIPISQLVTSSLPMHSDTAKEGASNKIRTLILLDGTWKKAFKMWQLSSNLQLLPTVNLDNADNGNYRIRKSPKDQGVSTVEAGYLALIALEEHPEKFQPLLDTFNKMIDFQIQQMPEGIYQKNYGASSN